MPKKARERECQAVVIDSGGRLDGVAYLRGWQRGMLAVWRAIAKEF